MESYGDSLYQEALLLYEPLLENSARRAQYRYEIHGRIDEEDFAQIARMSLHTAIRQYPGNSITDTGFKKFLTTVIWHDFQDEVDKHRAKMRDHRRDVHESTLVTQNGNADGTPSRVSPFRALKALHADPAAKTLWREYVRLSRQYLEEGSDEWVLFNEIAHTNIKGPTTELAEEYQKYQQDKGCWYECKQCGYTLYANYEAEAEGERSKPCPLCNRQMRLCGGRAHTQIPLDVYARMFGWKRSYARKLLSDIRRQMIGIHALDKNVFSFRA